MKRKDYDTLLKLLSEFFEQDFNKKNFVYQNPVASLIKQKMKEFGRWKNLPRGKHGIKID